MSNKLSNYSMDEEGIEELAETIHDGVKYLIDNMVDEVHDRDERQDKIDCIGSRKDMIDRIMESRSVEEAKDILYEEMFSCTREEFEDLWKEGIR